MTFKERLEQSPVHYLLGAVVVAFTAGFGAYEGILRVSAQETIARQELAELRAAKEKGGRQEKELDACRGGLVPAAAVQRTVPTLSPAKTADIAIAEASASTPASTAETNCPSLDGVWRRNVDGATVHIRQVRCVIEFFSEGNVHTHIMKGSFDESVFRVTTLRRNVETACETRLFGYFKPLDSKHFQSVVESADGKCDLEKSFSEDFVWTRI